MFQFLIAQKGICRYTGLACSNPWDHKELDLNESHIYSKTEVIEPLGS